MINSLLNHFHEWFASDLLSILLIFLYYELLPVLKLLNFFYSNNADEYNFFLNIRGQMF